jgi:hypothetical protein
MVDVITFQIEQLKKLFTGQSLSIPDLGAFLSLFVAESIVVAQIGIPLAIAGYEEGKKRKWWA